MRVCQFRHFGTQVNVQRKRLDWQQFLVLQSLGIVSNLVTHGDQRWTSLQRL